MKLSDKGVTNNSGIRDNYRRGNVADFLKSQIKDGYTLTPEEIKIVENSGAEKS